MNKYNTYVAIYINIFTNFILYTVFFLVSVYSK